MLWTIAVVLLILWALGLVTGTTISGFIHVLLVIAIVMVLVRIISGRRLV
jgi:hypothetical protein